MKQAKHVLLILIVLAFFYGRVQTSKALSTTALGAAAAAMQPGTWAELITNNWDGGSINGGGGILEPCQPSASNIVEYADPASWDPISKKLLFVGYAHGDCGYGRFVIYDDATNRWSIGSFPSQIAPSGLKHAYFHNTINPATGTAFYVDNNDNNIVQFDTDGSQTWSIHSTIPLTESAQSTPDMVYFPEMNGLLYMDGAVGVWFYSNATGQWRRLADTAIPHDPTLPQLQVGGYRTVGIYNPVHHVVLFGWGLASTHPKGFYVLSADGTFSSLRESPFDIIDTVDNATTVDPVSGDYIVFRADGSYYAYKVTTDTWVQLPGTAPIAARGYFEGMMTPVATYGVMMFADHQTRKVWLYKHNPSPDTVQLGISNIAVNAISSSGATINFTTNQSADTQVEYGTTISYGSSTSLNTALVTAHSATLGGLAPHTAYNYRIKTKNVAGSLAISGNQTFTTTDVITTPTGGDFATRCSATGVVKCVGFDQASDIAGTYGDNSGILPSAYDASVKPTLDTDVRSGGNSSLKFTIPPVSGPDSSGSYFTNFSSDLSTQFGENSEFYVQWRQRFSPEFLTGPGGWKQEILTTGDQVGHVFSSCQATTIVVNTYHPAVNFPILYNSCTGSASHGPYDGFYENTSVGVKLQNARPAPYCLTSQGYAIPVTFMAPDGNCFGYFPNEWMTFQIHVKTGPRVGDEFTNSYVQFWMGRQGQPSELVVDWGPYNLSVGSLAENQRYGKIWLTPYSTRKDPSVVNPTAYTWYDELIISTNKIAEPTGVTPSVPPPPPSPTITNISPGTITGQTATTLTVSGTNFQSNLFAMVATPSGVYNLNTSGLTFVSSSQVQVQATFPNPPSGQNSYTATLNLVSGGILTTGTFTVTAGASTNPSPPGSIMLVDFGSTAAATNFGLSGWSTILKDTYTDYVDYGPGGTTIVAGDNATYNYQGVSGTTRSFNVGDQVSVTWYNNSATAITFTPNLSFTDPDRMGMQTDGVWYPMNVVTVPPFGTAASQYTVSLSTAGSYSLVNVNVNYFNSRTILADRIDLVPSNGGGTSDYIPPTVSLTVPASGASVSGSAVSVSATAIDNVGVAAVQFKLDGANFGAEQTSAPYSLSWNTTQTANGAHTLTAVARDAAGNQGTSSLTVTVNNASGPDTVSPTVAITNPSADATVAGTAVAIYATASDSVGVVGVRFRLDGINVGVEQTSVPYSISWNTTQTANGAHTLTAIARDAAGNQGTSSLTVTVNNVSGGDTVPPTVAITSPSANATVTGTAVAVSATASDNVAVAGVQFKMDGANLGAEQTSSPYTVTWNSAKTQNGTHALSVVARDAAGNQATSTITITVSNALDTTPPLVSITSPAANATVFGLGVTLAAAATDNVGVMGVRFRVDGVNVGSEVTTAPYSLNWNTGQISNGLHTVTAVARDGAGNQTTSFPVPVTVSNTSSTVASLSYSLSSNQAVDWTANDSTQPVNVGYAKIQPVGNTNLAGAAIFSFRSNGVLVSQASVPVSTLIQSGRIYVNVNGASNTGLAIANPNAESVVISFYFTDISGRDYGSGAFVLQGNHQMATFLNQQPFGLPNGTEGTLTFTSTSSISAVALRGLTNQRDEFLMTTLPVASVGASDGAASMVLPQLAIGGGWTTKLILVNPTDTSISGTAQFFDSGSNGPVAPLAVGTNGTLNYSIPPHGVWRVVLGANSGTLQVGSARITATNNTAPASGAAIFSYTTNGVTVSEASVPILPTTTALRLYAESYGTPGAPGFFQTGVALANPAAVPVVAKLELIQTDGTPTGLSASVTIPAGGQIARFLRELVPNVPDTFKGVLRITTPTAIAAAGLRLTINERLDALVTTTPVANETSTATYSALMFPHIVGGGGYTTEFVLFNRQTGQSASGTVSFLTQDGAAMPWQ